MSPSWSGVLGLLESQSVPPRSPIHVPLLNPPRLGQKRGFLLKCRPAQSVFSDLFQFFRVSRKILARECRMGTAMGRKSGM